VILLYNEKKFAGCRMSEEKFFVYLEGFKKRRIRRKQIENFCNPRANTFISNLYTEMNVSKNEERPF
jgi:hypothetical protein